MAAADGTPAVEEAIGRAPGSSPRSRSTLIPSLSPKRPARRPTPDDGAVTRGTETASHSPLTDDATRDANARARSAGTSEGRAVPPAEPVTTRPGSPHDLPPSIGATRARDEEEEDAARVRGDGEPRPRSEPGTSPGVFARVSESDRKLVERYDAMQTDFFLETRGFAMAQVEETRRWFHFEEPPGVGVWPLPYTQLGLPKDCARLVVLSLVDAPAVAAAGAACAREMVKLLGPCGAACFNVSRNAYHVSVFFLSTPTEPTADPLSSPRADGGANAVATPATTDRPQPPHAAHVVNVSLASAPLTHIGSRFQPAHDAEAREVEAAARDVSPSFDADAVVLEVDRVAVAVSGALLLLFRDPNGDLGRLRERLRARFPNAPRKQTTIAHCTLLRAFPKTGDALTTASSGRVLADAKALCARWTARVRGTRVRVDRAWLVREERFSSIDGARRAFTFGSVSA